MFASVKDRIKHILVFLGIGLLFSSGWSIGIPRAFAGDWRQAKGSWRWNFPRDHGSHPEFRTEWWYFTGNLRDAGGQRYGYQLTFFRQGIRQKPGDPANPWSVRDLYPAHFTLTDVSRNQFWNSERLSRNGPGLAGASEKTMDVWLLNWSAKMDGRTINLTAHHPGMDLSLRLTPRKPLVFHGQNGLSKKGPDEGQASYYFSYTDLETRGRIKTPLSPAPIDVQGTSWLDHEFGSNQLASNQTGWDWFSLHVSDGHDLMIYLLRRKDGSLEPSSSGTLVNPDGGTTHLRLPDIRVEVLDRWKSPVTGGSYPVRWQVRVLSRKTEITLSALVAAQELVTEGSTGVVYWEGAVEGKGTSGGKEISCEGYVEMTGYAGSLGGLF